MNILRLIGLAILFVLSTGICVNAQSTVFNYQGSLKSGGVAGAIRWL